MSFLSPDNTRKGGGGVDVMCCPSQEFLSLEGSVDIFKVDLGLVNFAVFGYVAM